MAINSHHLSPGPPMNLAQNSLDPVVAGCFLRTSRQLFGSRNTPPGGRPGDPDTPRIAVRKIMINRKIKPGRMNPGGSTIDIRNDKSRASQHIYKAVELLSYVRGRFFRCPVVSLPWRTCNSKTALVEHTKVCKNVQRFLMLFNLVPKNCQSHSQSHWSS